MRFRYKPNFSKNNDLFVRTGALEYFSCSSSQDFLSKLFWNNPKTFKSAQIVCQVICCEFWSLYLDRIAPPNIQKIWLFPTKFTCWPLWSVHNIEFEKSLQHFAYNTRKTAFSASEYSETPQLGNSCILGLGTYSEFEMQKERKAMTGTFENTIKSYREACNYVEA